MRANSSKNQILVVIHSSDNAYTCFHYALAAFSTSNVLIDVLLVGKSSDIVDMKSVLQNFEAFNQIHQLFEHSTENARDSILSTAEQHNYGLIVISKNVEQQQMGVSVSHHLADKIDAALLVVPASTIDFNKPQQLIIPTDYQRVPLNTAHKIAWLSNKMSLHILFLHALAMGETSESFYANPDSPFFPITEDEFSPLRLDYKFIKNEQLIEGIAAYINHQPDKIVVIIRSKKGLLFDLLFKHISDQLEQTVNVPYLIFDGE